MLNEASIIHYLKTEFPHFIGDDAAIISMNNTHAQVITKDLLIEDIHFRTNYFSPEDLAHKALHVNLSDIAAMGANAKFILCGIGIPENKGTYVREFLSHLTQACKKLDIILIGGDTVKSPDKFFISITAIGIGANKNIKYRSMAQVGDYICVVGHLGHAHLGFTACERSLSDFNEYKNAFLRPTPKIKEGIWLASHAAVTSMMDISDGLFIDLKRLCEASHVAGIIQAEHLVKSSNFITACHDLSLDPIETMLTGGEDYGLLFTISPDCYQDMTRDFLDHFSYSIQYIGCIFKGEGVSMTENGQSRPLNLKPFTHFSEKV